MITVYHNPACGTSRSVLALVEASGQPVTVVEYLNTGWTLDLLHSLLGQMQAKPRDILRSNAAPAEALGLLDPNVNDDMLLEAMAAHPILVNRPIVVTPKGTKLCRPAELVMALL